MIDYYRTLGVSRTATLDEIKAAYRRLALATHPDHHGGDKRKEERLKEINAAYDVLSDPRLRAEYDRRLAPSPPPRSTAQPTSPPPGAPPPGAPSQGSSPRWGASPPPEP